LNYPAAGANGNATTLDLLGINLPAAVTLNLTSFLNGTISLRTQVNSNGDSVINGPISLNGTSIVQLQPATGTLTVNGNITESAPGAFSGTLFARSNGTTVFNGTINLPTAGATLAQTDAGTLVLNSTGNTFSAASALVGTFRIGANNAIPVTATLNLGQNDGSSPTFNLNGFNQTFGNLVYTAGTGGTKTITNTATALSTLTLNQVTDTTMGGVIGGNLAFVKGGAGNLTLNNANSTFTGDLTINAGTVTASALSGGTNGTLGRVNLAGRTVTLNNAGSTLAFTSNNIFGNGVNNANLPSVVLNSGTTLTSTRYNVLGAVTLNGGALTQSATDTGAYEGFQFKGTVTAGGAAASLISTGNGKANHLDANTVFNVSDATASSAVDLLVSTPLRNQSGDFGNAIGGLTKSGAGTLELSATNTYTGATTVNAGNLLVTGNIGGSTTAVNAGGTLLGTEQ
jgi:autotransporter-associated beta strand protein